MKNFVLTAGLLTLGLMATDFTQLSTEELAALRGTVAVEDRVSYQEELQSRLASLTQEEREAIMSKKENAVQGQTRTRSRAMNALNGEFGSGNGAGNDGSSLGAGAHGGNSDGGHGGGHGGGMR